MIFKSLSLKLKLIIFILLSLVGIGLLANTYRENVEREKKLQITLETELKAAEQKKQDKEEENRKKAEEERKRLEEQRKAEEKRKALEEKYERAREAYFRRSYDEAIGLADEIISEDPQNYKAYAIKGITICYGYSFKFDEGMSAIDKALEIKPDYGYGRFSKAFAYELFGHHDQAIEWYQKALQVEDYVWSYYELSSVYAKKGDLANTLKYLKLAIEKDPKAREYAETEADFANVRSSKEFQELIKK